MDTVEERRGPAQRDGRGEPDDRAACAWCGEPTEYPARGHEAVLCPVCEWQDAERAACSC